MTREELVKQKAQEFTSSGEFSPTLTECFIAGAEWEHKRLIEKACECLVTNAKDSAENVLDFMTRFKRAMEE